MTNGAAGGHTETTTGYDADGQQTGTTQRAVDGDGNQVITTENEDGETTSEVHIGADTEGPGDLESPADEALRRLTG
jgi:hypothetical protein